MNSTEEKKTKTTFILISIGLIITLIVFTLYLFQTYMHRIHLKIIQEYKEVYMQKSKSEIKSVVNYFVKSISFERNQKIKSTEKELLNELNIIVNLLKIDERIHIPSLQIVESIACKNSSITVTNGNGTIICSRLFPKGKNLKQILGINLNKTKNSSSLVANIYLEKIHKKQVYIVAYKYLPDYNMYLFKFYNLNNIDDALKDKFKEEIASFRYGIKEKRYVFIIKIVKSKGKIKVIRVVNPNTPKRLWGKEIPLNTKDINGKEFVKDIVLTALNKGSGFVKYKFKIINENKISQKITYVKYYKPWGWIIGSGFYPEIYKRDLLKKDINLKNTLKKYVINLAIEMTISSLMLLAIFLWFTNSLMEKIFNYRKKLESKESFLNHLIESIPTPIVIVDREGKFIKDNKSFRELLCIEKGDLNLLAPTESNLILIRKYALEFMQTENEPKREIWIFRKCGTGSDKTYLELYYSTYKTQENEGAIVTIFDITDKLKEKEKLKEITIKDELTGLFNRRYFNEIMEKETKRACRYNDKLSMIIYDIDHFKKINDTYGHKEGDNVLKKLSEVVKNSIRTTDYLFRIGGEEFAILLPSTPIDNAFKAAEKIRKKVELTYFENIGHITISLGVSEYRECEKVDDFFKRVDSALYMSKENGRNRTSKL